MIYLGARGILQESRKAHGFRQIGLWFGSALGNGPPCWPTMPVEAKMLDTSVLGSIARQMIGGDEVEVGGRRLPVRYLHFNLPQQIHDLLWLVPLV